jgi:microcystin-dependent protein
MSIIFANPDINGYNTNIRKIKKLIFTNNRPSIEFNNMDRSTTVNYSLNINKITGSIFKSSKDYDVLQSYRSELKLDRVTLKNMRINSETHLDHVIGIRNNELASVVNLVPTGSVSMYAGAISPSGWLFCDGTEVSRVDYSELFSVIGTTYGSSSSTTFTLPNFFGRVPVGVKNLSGFNLGNIGGAETHTLSISEIPSHNHTGSNSTAGAHIHAGSIANTSGAHTHTITDTGHTHNGTTSMNGTHSHQLNMVDEDDGNFSNQPGQHPVGDANKFNGDDHMINTELAGSHNHTFTTDSNTTGITINSSGDHGHSLTLTSDGSHTHTLTINNTGGGQAHNNMQPFLCVNYIIKF